MKSFHSYHFIWSFHLYSFHLCSFHSYRFIRFRVFVSIFRRIVSNRSVSLKSMPWSPVKWHKFSRISFLFNQMNTKQQIPITCMPNQEQCLRGGEMWQLSPYWESLCARLRRPSALKARPTNHCRVSDYAPMRGKFNQLPRADLIMWNKNILCGWLNLQ